MISWIAKAILPSKFRGHLRRLGFLLISRLFVVEFCLQFLRHRQEILEADFIYFYQSASFGHQGTIPDFLVRRFWKRRLLVLFIDYGIINPYILDSFRPVLQVLRIKPSRLARWFLGQRQLSDIVYEAALFIAFPFTMKRKTIVRSVYDRSLVPVGRESYLHFYPQWLRLMSQVPEADVKPSHEHIQRFRAYFQKVYPDLACKWFVSIYLRRKFDWRKVSPEVFRTPDSYRVGSESFCSFIGSKPDVRDTYQPPYRAVVQRISELGGFVFLGGEVDLQVFADLPNWVSYSNFEGNRFLVDFFFLTQCRFLVCGQSGPAAVAAVFRVPTLIANNPFFFQSGYRGNQIEVYKKVRDRHSGRFLKSHELFSSPVVEYHNSRHFEEAGLEVVDNDESEIMLATEEMIDRCILGKKTTRVEDSELYNWFRDLLPEWSIAYQSPAKPSLSYLKALQSRC